MKPSEVKAALSCMVRSLAPNVLEAIRHATEGELDAYGFYVFGELHRLKEEAIQEQLHAMTPDQLRHARAALEHSLAEARRHA
jgi:hypothetical protein